MACKSLINRKIIKYFNRFLLLLLIIFINFSCDNKNTFDENMLYGKWRSGTEYYRYDHGYRGVTWDESDDFYEDEAQIFEWSLNGDELTHIHIMEIGGGRIPRVYTVTELSSTTLKYYGYNKNYVFRKEF